MGVCDRSIDAASATGVPVVTSVLTASPAFTLVAWSSVLRLPVLSHLPRLSDLVYRFEFRLDPSDRLPTVPLPKDSLLTPLPRLLRWIVAFAPTTRPSFLLLPLPRFPLVVYMCLIQPLRLRNLLVQIPLPVVPRSTTLRFSNPRKTLLVLHLPLIESPAAIRGRELDTALGFDELDVVSPNAVALNELFLLLVPRHLFSFPLVEDRFVTREVERSVPNLFNKRSAIPERVPETI